MAKTRTALVALLIASLLALTLASTVPGNELDVARVHSVYFDTSCVMPTYTVSPAYTPIVKSIQHAVGTVPEGIQLAAAVGMFSNQFGLTETQTEELQVDFRKAYDAMATDPQIAELTSAMDEAIATDPERKGHYFAYVPEDASSESPTVLFLHGYGGNLQFYIWALKESVSRQCCHCTDVGHELAQR